MYFRGGEEGKKKAGEKTGSVFIKIAKWGVLLGVPIIALLILGTQVAQATGIGGYVPYLSENAAEEAAPAVESDAFEGLFSGIEQAKAKFSCMLKGPQCLQQWRLNNTQRPGSNEVGERYGLEIRRFEVGQGSKIDVSRYDTESPIPVSYSIYNTRNGLKGINAFNVSLRISMTDSGEQLCSTGWRPVSGYSIRGDTSENFNQNDIYPGTTAFEGFAEVEGFNLKNCEGLTPGAGDRRNVRLDIKYDYFSQASLKFQAMDVQYLISNPNVEGPDGKLDKSRTADTPVKAAIGVDSPVLFNSEQGSARPFSMGATVNTDESDLSYKVENLTVTKSRRTEIVRGENDVPERCSFVKGGRENLLLLKEDVKKNIISTEDWFTSDNQPTIFGCKMKLTRPATISPSGETLSMGIEANYTVKIEEGISSFEIYNSRCTDLNCPLVVAQSSPIQDWGRYICEGRGAGNGCTAVKEPGKDKSWGRAKTLTGSLSDNPIDQKLEEEEVAIDPVAANGSLALTSEFKDKFSKVGQTAFGIKLDTWSKISDSSPYALFSDGEETKFVSLSKDNACSASDWEKNTAGNLVIAYNPAENCGSPSGDGDCPDGTYYDEQTKSCEPVGSA